MPRRPRAEVEGGVHHVYARGNDRRRIFLDDEDRSIYLRMLAAVVRARKWRCLAYCLLDNHLHLLLETSEPNLGSGMRDLHGLYAQDFNVRRGRSGHLFQGRFGSTLMRSDEQLWHTAAYIARNPVEAGACARPEQWPWSSHRFTLDGSPPEWLDARRLLSYFLPAGGDAVRRYEEAVNGNGGLAHRGP